MKVTEMPPNTCSEPGGKNGNTAYGVDVILKKWYQLGSYHW